jgi:hypothetical protein
MTAKKGDGVTEAIAELYDGPLETFVQRRRELERARKMAGDGEGARRIASAAKPTHTAWGLDQVARRHPELVATLLEAGDEAAKAQMGGAEETRAAVREYRARVAEVLQEARSAMRAAGFEPNAAQLRRMALTVHAASTPQGEARALLVAGVLDRDVELEDPFAGLEVIAGPAARGEGRESERARGRTRDREREREREQEHERQTERAREKARQAARDLVRALEEKARSTRMEARAAESAAKRAREQADRARQAAEEVDVQLRAAREELRAAGG